MSHVPIAEKATTRFCRRIVFPIPKPVVSAKHCKARPVRRCRNYMYMRHLRSPEKRSLGKVEIRTKARFKLLNNEGRLGNYGIGSWSSTRRQSCFTNLYVGQRVSICSNRHWEKLDLFEDARITRIRGTGGIHTCPKKLSSGKIKTRKGSDLESSTAMTAVVESDIVLC